MTNWMTAAGLALIAGGLATLISFRGFLFGGGERRAGRRQAPARALEAPRRRPALPAGPAVPDRSEPEPAAEEQGGRSRRGRRGRRRALVTASGRTASVVSDPEERGGLASIGLADEDEDDRFAAFDPAGRADDVSRARRDRFADFSDLSDLSSEDDEIAIEDIEPEEAEDELGTYADLCAEADDDPDPPHARQPDRYGDRVEGWVRPEYRKPDQPRPGEYWTPIPVDLEPDPEPSAKGYGWPRPVERLPAVPDYEPATGFDLVPVVSEPTEVVPAWPMNDERPGRIRLPRAWAGRDEKPSRAELPDAGPLEFGPPGAGLPRNGRPHNGRPGVEHPNAGRPHAEHPRDEHLRAERPRDERQRGEKSEPPRGVKNEPAARRRPRPRPRSGPADPVDRSTVYVSRHAADPPPH